MAVMLLYLLLESFGSLRGNAFNTQTNFTVWMGSSWISGWYLAGRLERLAAYAEVATVLGSIPASSDTVEFEVGQMRQCWIQYIEEEKIPLFFYYTVYRHRSSLLPPPTSGEVTGSIRTGKRKVAHPPPPHPPEDDQHSQTIPLIMLVETCQRCVSPL